MAWGLELMFPSVPAPRVSAETVPHSPRFAFAPPPSHNTPPDEPRVLRLMDLAPKSRHCKWTEGSLLNASSALIAMALCSSGFRIRAHK
jgi:hypothetical protein